MSLFISFVSLILNYLLYMTAMTWHMPDDIDQQILKFYLYDI